MLSEQTPKREGSIMTGLDRRVSSPIAGLLIALLLLFGPAGCDSQPSGPQGKQQPPPPKDQEPEGVPTMTITIRSAAFAAGQPISKRHTDDGEDVSPALSWAGVPDNAKELALIMDDPDAPTPEPWVHWVIYKLPAATTGLAEGIATSAQLSEPAGALQGENSWGTLGYRGPAPPGGLAHHYHFKVYALDVALDVAAGLDKKQLLDEMHGHVIAEGELVGTYER